MMFCVFFDDRGGFDLWKVMNYFGGMGVLFDVKKVYCLLKWVFVFWFVV